MDFFSVKLFLLFLRYVTINTDVRPPPSPPAKNISITSISSSSSGNKLFSKLTCKLKVLSEDKWIVSGGGGGEGPWLHAALIPSRKSTLEAFIHFAVRLIYGDNINLLAQTGASCRSPWKPAGVELLALAALALFSFASFLGWETFSHLFILLC